MWTRWWKNSIDYFRRRWAAEGGYRQVLIIAIPLIFSSAGFAIQQFVDRMFLAWYSSEAIAATMPAGLIISPPCTCLLGREDMLVLL